jgi:hypothetical protein
MVLSLAVVIKILVSMDTTGSPPRRIQWQRGTNPTPVLMGNPIVPDGLGQRYPIAYKMILIKDSA